MIEKITAVLFFTFSIISLSSAEPLINHELSASLSEKAFYSKPEAIIHKFDKRIGNCQNNYILAGAYRNKKELKKALLYYTNSCFDKNFNFNIRLFPDPIYRFTGSPNEKSIFYRDSIYKIASIFYDYGEHEYVLKFSDLIERDDSALYRDSVLLRTRSLLKLNRFKNAIDALQLIIPSYKDSESLSLIHLRLGAIYESAGDLQNAVESYLNVIKSAGGVWQNSVASKRLVYLTTEKKIKLDSADKNILFAKALYDAKDYNRALTLAEAAIPETESSDGQMIILKMHTIKNSPEAAEFLKEREGKSGYDELLLEHANILWEMGKKIKAVKVYTRLISSSDIKISEKVLTRLSFFYESKKNPEFIRYMEMYIEKFPEEIQCGRFIWLMGRFYMNYSNKQKAVDYFTRGINRYPDNSYTSYCRFWMNKISAADNNSLNYIKILEELAVNNPDSYHTLSLLKLYADKLETSELLTKFQQAAKKNNSNELQLYHALLFIKNGYTTSYTERLEQLDTAVTSPYKKLADLMNNPHYTSRYKLLVKHMELYFYAGDIEAINREIKLFPENDKEAQIDLALALTVYSMKYRYYNFSTLYSFKLLNLLELKENLSLIPQNFAAALYPYAFADCVDDATKKNSVKPELILAMIKVESNFNHRAVSPVGASGLMQLMPDTAKDISKKISASKYDLFDPCTSIKFGSNYIAWLNKYFDSQIEYMAAAYNAGAGNVSKWKKRPVNKDIDYFAEFTPFDETRDYIFRTKKCLIQYESIYKQ